MRSRFEPLTASPVGREESAIVHFTTGRAVERNGWVKYCVIQITDPSRVENRQAARFQPAVSNGYNGTAWLYVNPVGMNAHVMFKALEEAMLNGCDGDWFFVGDDDTLFYQRGIEKWLTQRKPQEKWLAAHGSLWEVQKASKSWFTGGSGVAITGSLAKVLRESLTQGSVTNAAAEAFSWCNCFDVPFARAIVESGGRLFHQPNLFLDSCLDCDSERRGVFDMPIVSCHAATMFRSHNPHAQNKRGDELGESLRGQDYAQSAEVAATTDPKARRSWFDAKCEKTRK